MTQYQKRLAPFLENIFDAMDDGVYITDKHGTTLHVNTRYRKLTGLTSEALLGKNVHALKKNGIFDKVVNPEVVETGRPTTSVQVLQGGKRVVLRGFPVFDDANDLALVITLVRDVTLIGQMRDQILHQKELISLYHTQIEHLSAKSAKIDAAHESPQIKQLTELIKRVAGTDATILLLGETGVGKDWFARMAHEHSLRKDNIFLKVDCGSISEHLIESELFGYAPGAFTGASSKGKLGHFEIADKGTLFLDEIGELPLPMQAKLLRVLQDQEVMRVGSSTPKKVDVRIIAATNRDLEAEMKRGNFRSDLFYRLRVAVVDIPPLREGPTMIPGLVNHFLQRYCTKYKKKILCSPEAMTLFKAYGWPGNIRELENSIQSLVVTCEGTEILPKDLPPGMNAPPFQNIKSPSGPLGGGSGKPLKEIMGELEKKVIQQALDHYGSVNKASEVLGINRTTLFRKMREEKEEG